MYFTPVGLFIPASIFLSHGSILSVLNKVIVKSSMSANSHKKLFLKKNYILPV